MIEHILKYFPGISDQQKIQYEKILNLYPEWNEKINVISRKDIDNLEINHILHSLGIAKFINFAENSRILDFGAGGGLPSIPLAILFPNVNFHLIDRVGKKIMVAENIASEIGLNNVSFQHGDSGECHDKFDFVISRGVMPQPDLVRLSKKNISSVNKNPLPNGLISLKGGCLTEEIKPVRNITEIVNLSNYFDEPFFEEKKIVYTII